MSSGILPLTIFLLTLSLFVGTVVLTKKKRPLPLKQYEEMAAKRGWLPALTSLMEDLGDLVVAGKISEIDSWLAANVRRGDKVNDDLLVLSLVATRPVQSLLKNRMAFIDYAALTCSPAALNSLLPAVNVSKAPSCSSRDL